MSNNDWVQQSTPREPNTDWPAEDTEYGIPLDEWDDYATEQAVPVPAPQPQPEAARGDETPRQASPDLGGEDHDNLPPRPRPEPVVIVKPEHLPQYFEGEEGGEEAAQPMHRAEEEIENEPTLVRVLADDEERPIVDVETTFGDLPRIDAPILGSDELRSPGETALGSSGWPETQTYRESEPSAWGEQSQPRYEADRGFHAEDVESTETQAEPRFGASPEPASWSPAAPGAFEGNYYGSGESSRGAGYSADTPYLTPQAIYDPEAESSAEAFAAADTPVADAPGPDPLSPSSEMGSRYEPQASPYTSAAFTPTPATPAEPPRPVGAETDFSLPEVTPAADPVVQEPAEPLAAMTEEPERPRPVDVKAEMAEARREAGPETMTPPAGQAEPEMPARMAPAESSADEVPAEAPVHDALAEAAAHEVSAETPAPEAPEVPAEAPAPEVSTEASARMAATSATPDEAVTEPTPAAEVADGAEAETKAVALEEPVAAAATAGLYRADETRVDDRIQAEMAEEERREQQVKAEKEARDQRLGRVATSEANAVREAVPPLPRKGVGWLGSVGLLLLRFIVAGIAAIIGYQMLSDVDGAAETLGATIIPEPRLVTWIVGFALLGIAVLLVIGLAVRFAGLLLALIAGCALAFLRWGAFTPFVAGVEGFLGDRDLLLATIGVLLLTLGGGRLGIDGAIAKARAEAKAAKQG